MGLYMVFSVCQNFFPCQESRSPLLFKPLLPVTSIKGLCRQACLQAVLPCSVFLKQVVWGHCCPAVIGTIRLFQNCLQVPILSFAPQWKRDKLQQSVKKKKKKKELKMSIFIQFSRFWSLEAMLNIFQYLSYFSFIIDEVIGQKQKIVIFLSYIFELFLLKSPLLESEEDNANLS